MTDLNNAIDTLKVDVDKLTADINKAVEAKKEEPVTEAVPATV